MQPKKLHKGEIPKKSKARNSGEVNNKVNKAEYDLARVSYIHRKQRRYIECVVID